MCNMRIAVLASVLASLLLIMVVPASGELSGGWEEI